MTLTEISLRRPVLMTMLILGFVVLGLFSLTRLGIDLTPEVDFPFVIVSIVYPGAGPEEVETAISDKVEEEFAAIPGLRNVSSISQEGLALIICEFEQEVEVDQAANEVKDKLSLVRVKLPRDIMEPVIQKFDIAAFPIINLAVSSPRPLEETYRWTEEVIKRGLLRIRGVANVELVGAKEREIQVHLSRRKLREYNLSPQMVSGVIAAANLNVPGGHLEERRQEVTVRLEGEFTDLDQLRSIEIPLPKGRKVKLAEIGWVEDTFKEIRERTRFNGEGSIGVSIIKRSGANTVKVADQVFQQLATIRKELPPDIRVDVARDRSQFIRDAVNDVFGNLIVGALLTAAVLFLFLHSLPYTLVAAVSIPTSVIATFILIDFAGFTLNFMSLSGLAISVGILTANSIVVLENIGRYRQMGIGPHEAASRGTSEVATAVIASTLTNVVVFTPIAFMSGLVGQFFKQFGLTVTFATLFSLLVSFTLTPMMMVYPLRVGIYIVAGLSTFLLIWWRMGIDPALLFLLVCGIALLTYSYGLMDRLFELWENFYRKLQEGYRRALAWSLNHKSILLGSTLLAFLGSLSLLFGGLIGSEFFPKADSGFFTVSVEMPVGTALDHTDRTVMEIARRAAQLPYVKSIYTTSGRTELAFMGSGQGVNLGMVLVTLIDKSYRDLTTAQVMEKLQSNLTDIPGVKLVLRETQMMGGGGQSDIQVEVIGEEITTLMQYADSVVQKMEEIGGLTNIEISWKTGKPEWKLVPRREVISDQGLNLATVGMFLRTLIEGDLVSKYREKGKEYDIRVKLDPGEIASGQDLEAVYIKTGDRQVPLSQLVEFQRGEGPTSITHKNKKRVIYVYADVTKGSMGEKVAKLRAYTSRLNLPPGYTIYYGGQAERMAESFAELFKALILAIILTYMVLAAIINSYRQPFAIMLTLPLGLIGVLLSLVLTGKNISIFALMAMVMLVGIVVNNGILLVDYTNFLRSQGRRVEEALLEACPVRLRPIIMTNLAALLGMLPLSLGLGAAGELRSPLGIVTIGGLITSTIFTLFVIPVIYRIMERDR